jgi:TPR repeat protein
MFTKLVKGYIKESCEALDKMNRHEQDIIKLRKLCSLNDSYSCNKLAEAYLSVGMAVDYSFIMAGKLYQKSCDELNDKEACRRAENYSPFDEISEAKYAAKNCDEGLTSHCTTAARLYRYSEYLYNIALNSGEMIFPDPLTTTYVPKNINKAISYLLKACNKNSKEDCYELGDIYSTENEVKDTKKAAMYYEKACDIGYEPGCVKAANIKR